MAMLIIDKIVIVSFLWVVLLLLCLFEYGQKVVMFLTFLAVYVPCLVLASAVLMFRGCMKEVSDIQIKAHNYFEDNT